MKFESFIRSKRNAWARLDHLIENHRTIGTMRDEDMSELVRLYRATSADYAYARAHYGYDRVVVELNTLLGRAHQVIYGTRPFGWRHVWLFYARQFPETLARHRRFVLGAGLVLILGIVLAFLACLQSPEIPRQVLGEAYVETTLENIDRSDPFGIYKEGSSPMSSSFIMTNNIKVTFAAFGMGIFLGLGTLYVLFYNGLMLGSFLFIFFEHGLLTDALLTIMMHGTLELTCIIIAGGAGLMIGHALVFPGCYRRIDALRLAGLEAVKLILGVIPLLVLAGIFEGFVTRLTVDPWVKLAFIAANAAFLVWYFRSPRTPLDS